MNPITIAQTALGALLIITILLQQRGTGLSGTFGGGEGSTYSTRRGVEKIIFTATIVLAVLWIGVSVARLLIR